MRTRHSRKNTLGWIDDRARSRVAVKFGAIALICVNEGASRRDFLCRDSCPKGLILF
jgi:hypothetical protein